MNTDHTPYILAAGAIAFIIAVCFIAYVNLSRPSPTIVKAAPPAVPDNLVQLRAGARPPIPLNDGDVMEFAPGTTEWFHVCCDCGARHRIVTTCSDTAILQWFRADTVKAGGT